MIALFTGCDPVGLLRVRLRIPASTPGDGVLAVDQPGTEEALNILDRVVTPLGFKLTSEQPKGDFLRAYTFTGPAPVRGGLPLTRTIPICVRKTATGIEVAFGEFEMLGATSELADRAFESTRTAFIKRYGRKNVGTKIIGAANQPHQPTPGVRLGYILASSARRGCAHR